MLEVIAAAWLAGTAYAAPTGHALLVGASAPHTGGERPDAESDVRRVQKFLKRTYGYREFRSLVGAEATVGATLAAIASLASSVQAGDHVVVYFAAPGGEIADTNRDEPDPWDEALALADGWLVDDRLNVALATLEQKAGEVTLVLDTALTEGARYEGRFPDAEVEQGETGDGEPAWPRPGDLVLLDGARRGKARVDEDGGWFTTQLLDDGPQTVSWRDLEQRLLSTVLAGSQQLPDVRTASADALDRPSFGVALEIDAPEPGTFRVEPRAITVNVLETALPEAWADQLEDVAEEPLYEDWLSLESRNRDEAGSFSLSRYRFQTTAGGEDQGIAITGPGGATRARFAIASDVPTDLEARAVLGTLRDFARQATFLDLHPTSKHLQVQIVPAELQGGCSDPDRWRQAPPNAEQVVPVCHRWQVEVTLPDDAPRALEVGGLILANDGYAVGFPAEGRRTVTLSPGDRHRFALTPVGSDPGVTSTPPLGISESVVVYGGPPNSRIEFYDVSALGDISRGTARGAPKGWEQVVVPYRVEGAPDVDPSEPRRSRELTLNHFDVRYLLPPNERSYLHRLLLNTARLATMKGDDGIPYAQCVPDAEFAARSKLFPETAKWPNGQCWSKPWDFAADDAEFLDSPGVDCSTTVWWTYTRSCTGDRRLALPEVPAGTSNRDREAMYRKWHVDTRGCLLVSNARDRAGYQWTGGLRDPAIMEQHWLPCEGELRPGDLLVSQSPKTGSGHTYIVIDPDRYIVF
ncbi:MAG: caspase family protein, partial [Myxococcota bacterium]